MIQSKARVAPSKLTKAKAKAELPTVDDFLSLVRAGRRALAAGAGRRGASQRPVGWVGGGAGGAWCGGGGGGNAGGSKRRLRAPLVWGAARGVLGAKAPHGP